MSADVDLSGPFFDGRAVAAVSAFLEDAVGEVSSEAKKRVLEKLASSLQHPTGHYESSIHIDGGGTRQSVNDGGIVYGPWLEGVGSRNRTTRFKGYASFRRVRETVNADASRIAEIILRKYLGRMQ